MFLDKDTKAEMHPDPHLRCSAASTLPRSLHKSADRKITKFT